MHAFFTKKYKNNKPLELQKKLNLNSNIHFLKQVHSNKIIQTNHKCNLKPKTGDCLITKEKGQSLWVYSADCMPLLIADIATRNIAACHSGLKGLKQKIISKTLNRLIEIGSKKNNLIIAIGPSINGDKYQVKIKDVEDLIIQLTGERYTGKSYLIKLDKKEVLPLFKKDSHPDRLLFDIKAAAILELYKEGIQSYQIELNRICTFSNPKLFNSYRREKTNLRQWSCIYS
tara:strand:- start:656 stop:1345 length:690 start_codon:yes stop_codon:yes gene_type:complete